MQLPTEIFGNIFSHYAEQADDIHPVETLLLVNRSWHDAALAYCQVWSYIVIELGHIKSIERWRALLPLRLKRAGLIHPLEITLRNVYSIDAHPSSSFANRPKSQRQKESAENVVTGTYQVRHYILDFLQILAGKSGEQAFRWRSLHLDFGDQQWGRCLFTWKVLSYPTPSLRSLFMANLDTSGRDTLFGRSLLPSSPLLESGVLINCSVICYPDLGAAMEVSVSTAQGWVGRPIRPRKLKVGSRIRILRLSIPLNMSISLPTSLYELRHLKLGGENIPLNLQSLEAPNLTELTIEPDGTNLIPPLAQHALFLPQISRFNLSLAANMSIGPTYLQGILSKMHGLEVLRGNRRALEMVLYLVWVDALAGRDVETIHDEFSLSSLPSLSASRTLEFQWMEGQGAITIQSPLNLDSWKQSVEESTLRTADAAWSSYFCVKDID
ncbi:hypothetical protein FRC14_002281 [Serendipita sp. 396]|nr:hypothetical protein FRC14_002281 [Serendipita sp. 396]KAG8785038.1 hypothetical protein FRC15_002081 [Serendipita sp. 397]KAG8800769.1 hypothetical protein FRC16_002103 [Serendipita sp. 398]KAG8824570.1 hypothetical protein FRC19_001480 [Serendipita sp. 401]KAG8838951.1 hypothetical protein FRC18_001770 [Serendipita sp. 400]KAG8855764.1 hypothetical protein FRB91_001755 [Serendipita sp. 411]KAG8870675.1 hypothetical protein FRC20_011470 [Serendipita sp. 405]KAG9055738.1 hypothetical prot